MSEHAAARQAEATAETSDIRDLVACARKLELEDMRLLVRIARALDPAPKVTSKSVKPGLPS